MPKQDPSPTLDVAALMRAVQAAHPGLTVEVGLRSSNSLEDPERTHASVLVMGLPPRFANFSREGWPNEVYTTSSGERGVHLNVNRYSDGDVAAALSTALEFVTSRPAGAVAS